MFKIQTLNAISDVIFNRLTSDQYAVGKETADADAILVRSAAMHDMALPESLCAIARAGAGYNNIPVDACTQKGIVVYNTPGGNANAVAELAMGCMIAASRNMFEAQKWALTLKGEGDKVPALAEKGKGQFVGGELRGKKCAVIGLGAVGGKVANGAYNMKMSVAGYDPFLSVEFAWALSRGVKKASTMAEAVDGADFVTVHVPLTPDTRGYINAQLMEKMKDGVILLNLSRAELVDAEAVKAALDSGKIKKYVTDFATDELLGYPGVITLPHLGASTPESEDNCAAMAADQVADYLETGSIRNSVNFPVCELAAWPGDRVCILHRNAPNLIAQITGIFGNAGINIEHMVNKSRKDAAYTVLDLSSPANEAALAALRAIDGVYRVRWLAQ